MTYNIKDMQMSLIREFDELLDRVKGRKFDESPNSLYYKCIINGNNRAITLYPKHSKLSHPHNWITIREFNKLQNLKAKIIINQCRRLKDYVKEHPEVYIHITTTKINQLYSNQGISSNLPPWYQENYIFKNPTGFWFARGMKWAKRFSDCNKRAISSYQLQTKKRISSCSLKNNELYKELEWQWFPKYIYIVDIKSNNLNIKTIRGCRELHAFEREYSVHSASSINKMLDWTRIMNDYDGLLIEPWKGVDCVPYFNKLKKTKKHRGITAAELYSSSTEKLISNLATKSASVDDLKGLWQMSWDASSGCIWRNLEHVKLVLL